MTDMDKKQVLEFLRSVSVMSLAVNGEKGPISTILLFAVDDDFTFYFATHKNSFKASALLKDNRVGLSVWSFNQMLIQGDGVATMISDQESIDNTLGKLSDSVARLGDFWPPVLRITGGDYAVFKIEVNWLRKLDLSDNKIHGSNEQFLQIIG